MYDKLNGLYLKTMQDIFKTKSNYYNICNVSAFFSRNIKTVRYGFPTNSNIGPKP